MGDIISHETIDEFGRVCFRCDQPICVDDLPVVTTATAKNCEFRRLMSEARAQWRDKRDKRIADNADQTADRRTPAQKKADRSMALLDALA